MSVVIDTGEVAPAERFDLWAQTTPRVFEPLAVRPRGEAPFAGRVARYPLGPLTLYRLTADASRVTRTRAMIGASDPEWVQVSLLLGGRCVVDQDGRRSLLRAGDFASWASSRPYAVDGQTQHDLLVTYCPAGSLRSDRILRSIFSGLRLGLLLALASIGLSLIYGTTGLSAWTDPRHIN